MATFQFKFWSDIILDQVEYYTKNRVLTPKEPGKSALLDDVYSLSQDDRVLFYSMNMPSVLSFVCSKLNPVLKGNGFFGQDRSCQINLLLENKYDAGSLYYAIESLIVCKLMDLWYKMKNNADLLAANEINLQESLNTIRYHTLSGGKANFDGTCRRVYDIGFPYRNEKFIICENPIVTMERVLFPDNHITYTPADFGKDFNSDFSTNELF